MANYYYINIESEKMTQDVANEIFQTITPKQRIRWFDFSEGHLSYNTRGLIDITDILNAYDFNDKEDKIEIKDEFELVYEGTEKEQPEELSEEVKEALKTVKLEIDNIKKVLKNVNLTMPSLPNIENNHWWMELIK